MEKQNSSNKLRKMIRLKLILMFILLGFVQLAIGQSNGRYFSLKKALNEPKKVLYLEVHSSDFRIVPKEISKLVNVKEIVFRGNDIVTLPKSFKKLITLEELSLGNNENLDHAQVCEILLSLPNLKSLDLEVTNLNICPSVFFRMDQLKEIYLGLNGLSPEYIETIRSKMPGAKIYD